MMLLAVRKAVMKYNNILNSVTSLEYFLLSITITFVVADGPLTSINQHVAPILAVMFVLLGSVVTQ